MNLSTTKSVNFVKSVHLRVIHVNWKKKKKKMERTRLSLTPLSSISVISGWQKDIGKEQYARDQVYSVKNSAASGIQTHRR